MKRHQFVCLPPTAYDLLTKPGAEEIETQNMGPAVRKWGNSDALDPGGRAVTIGKIPKPGVVSRRSTWEIPVYEDTWEISNIHCSL